MDYQLLALDLDGTLTNSKKEVSEPTIKALIQIQEQGKKVVLASGRPTRGVVPLAEKLHLKDYGSYILSFNGGRITDCRTGQVIYNKTIPDDVALPLFHIAKKYAGADILAYTEDTILSGIRPNQYTELESRINHMQIIQAKDFPKEITEPSNKLLITGEPETIQRIKKKQKNTSAPICIFTVQTRSSLRSCPLVSTRRILFLSSSPVSDFPPSR